MKSFIPPKLTVKENRALRREIEKQLAENVENMSLDLQALVLWSLREELGFGRKRLLRFQKSFLPRIKELQEYYAMHKAEEASYICRYKLKNEVGIDVAELDTMFEFEIRTNN